MKAELEKLAEMKPSWLKTCFAVVLLPSIP
jgi:hypothetical protein